MLICQQRTMYLKGVAVGSIGYSISNFKQLAYFRLTIHKYTQLPSSNNASLNVCRRLDRIYPMEIWTFSIHPIDNPKTCSLAITRQCL